MKKIEKKLGHQFKRPELLETALTHSSVSETQSYERLEFLGDRVLGLVVAKMVFETFPDEPEGDLAKRHAVLVQRSTLFEIATDLNIGEDIALSTSETESGGRKKDTILSDVMESLFGAIYLDSDFNTAEKVVRHLFKDLVQQYKKPPQDPKTALQEFAQSLGKPLPAYELVNQTGPSHAPIFEISVTIEGFPSTRASGKSKREAEKKAAQLLLDSIKEHRL